MGASDNTLSIAIIQADLEWENPEANFLSFFDKIRSIKEDVDLVVLPETFSTGFSMNVKNIADGEGKSLDWMLSVAGKFKIHLTGSLIISENGNFFNRLYFVRPDQTYSYYDKRHLFRMGREQEYFSRGKNRVVVELGKFRILLQICYDLRFPVFARNRGDYDLILYVANWPSARAQVWDSLLIARAIENQSYVVAANRSGVDGLGEGNCGNSAVIDAKGKIIARLNEQPGILVSSLNYRELIKFREKFPVLKDADEFEIK